jgi:imidazolonepropionase-like amidohydrolase
MNQFVRSIALSAAFLGILLFAEAGSRPEKRDAPPSSPGISLAIVGATIIDGTGRPPLKGGTILIEGERISAVGPGEELVVPRGARIIQASRKYVIPGLMDSNVHLVAQRTVDYLARYEDDFEGLIEEAAQVALIHGQTSVFDTWGPLQPLLNVRDRIRAGRTKGSRIFVAGNCIGMSGPLGPDMNTLDAVRTVPPAFIRRINRIWEENVGPDLAYMTPDQVRLEVRAYAARGVDFLKYASSSHIDSRFLVFSEATQRAIVEEGHRAGLTVQAHTTTNESLRLAVEAGVDLVTHADDTGVLPISEETIAALAKKKIPCGIIPKTERRWSVEIDNRAGGPGAASDQRLLEMRRRNQITLIRAGVPILLNTDGGLRHADYLSQVDPAHWTDFGAIIGEGYFRGCQGMAEMGVPAMDIICAGTRNIASAYGKLGDLGTLEKGKYADLVILDADPLEDIRNLRKIASVVKNGEIVDREALPVRRILSPGYYVE